MKRIICFLIPLIVSYCYAQQNETKINGANLVAPPTSKITNLETLKTTHTKWVSIIPYAFIKKGASQVIFDTDFQWWGERSLGVEATIKKAKAHGFKIMIKPHIWVSGDGWAGDYILTTEKEWLQWEASYTNYILNFCRIAAKHDVALFCIGTELRQIIKNRPMFWNKLIKEIKTVYSGKLTYAANWDNYQNVSFWQDLDYIGIDSYFALSTKKDPTVKELETAWKPLKNKLKEFSKCNATPILFTEFGYPSTEFCTVTPWKEDNSHDENQQTQSDAYEALFTTFWKENWFAGGFFWKWHISNKTKRNHVKSYTPQNKKATETISKWYKK